MALLEQNKGYTRSFIMVLSADSRTGATGKTVSVSISKAGSPLVAATGAVTEIGAGWYAITVSTQDTNTLGDLVFHCSAAVCDDTDFVDEVRTPAQIAAINGTSTAFSSTMTRDELVTMAYKDIGVLADGEVLSSSLMADGVVKLNALIREIDAAGKWLWTETSATITLVANQWVYTTTNGMPTDLREPDRLTYRDALAQDWPVELVTREGYEAINNKTQQGDPSKAWIPATRSVGLPTLYVWPTLGTVNSTSLVVGSDGNTYTCIRSHTADSTNYPITGANYLLYWSLSGTGGSAWVSGTSYTAGQRLILWYRRPLYDFNAASDNPDLPTQWTRLLEYRLAADLADPAGVQLEERALLASKAKDAYQDLFKSTKPQSQDFHNKTIYM